jgi:hypothetical protein
MVDNKERRKFKRHQLKHDVFVFHNDAPGKIIDLSQKGAGFMYISTIAQEKLNDHRLEAGGFNRGLKVL